MTKFIYVRFFVLLKSDLDIQQTHLRLQFVEQKLMLNSSLGVTKFIIATDTILVILCSATLKSDLNVQQTHLRGRFVEQKLVLSSSFRCDQIFKDESYNFGHTLLCYLSRT